MLTPGPVFHMRRPAKPFITDGFLRMLFVCIINQLLLCQTIWANPGQGMPFG